MTDDVKYASIKDLRPGAKNLHCLFIVLDIGKPNKTKDGHEVRSCRVADKTGSINLSVWDEYGADMQCGDIVKLHKGYTTMFKGAMTIYISKGGTLERVGDFCMVFSEMPDMSNPSAEFIQQYKKTNDKGNRGETTTSNTHASPSTNQPPPPPPIHAPPSGPPGTNNSGHAQAQVDPRSSSRFHPYQRDSNQGNIVNAAKDPRLRNRASTTTGNSGRANGSGNSRSATAQESQPKNIINSSRDPRNRNR